MKILIATVVVVAALVWWLNRRWLAAERRRAAEEGELERHDHARAHELAKVQAELTRWSGPQ